MSARRTLAARASLYARAREQKRRTCWVCTLKPTTRRTLEAARVDGMALSVLTQWLQLDHAMPDATYGKLKHHFADNHHRKT